MVASGFSHGKCHLVTYSSAAAIKNEIFHAAQSADRADLSAVAPRKQAKETSPYLGVEYAARGGSDLPTHQLPTSDLRLLGLWAHPALLF